MLQICLGSKAHSLRETDGMIDQIEKAEIAEEKRPIPGLQLLSCW